MRFLPLSLALAAVLALGQLAAADGVRRGSPGQCAACGHHAPCQQKVCQVQCGTKTVTKHGWCVESEEFCPLLPRVHDPCDSGCNACGQPECAASACDADCDATCDQCSGLGCRLLELGKRPSQIVTPTTGKLRTRKKLVRKEYTVEVPVYKSVVRYVCSECDAQEAGPIEHEKPAKAAPKPKKKKVPQPDDQAIQMAPLPPL